MTPGARRGVWIVAAALGVAALAVAGWYGWRRYTAPEPPEVNLEGLDPDVAREIEAARQKVKESPRDDAAWAYLGKRLRGAYLGDDAATCFAQAERFAPDDPRWPYLRGEALALRDPDAALPHLRRAAELWNPGPGETVAPWLRLAELLLARQEYDEAEALLRRAAEADPGNVTVHLDLGLLASARGRLEESRTHLLRCLGNPYTGQKASARLAEVCRRLGKAAEAARFEAQALSLRPDQHWPDPLVAECLRLGVGRPVLLRKVEELEARRNHAEVARLLEQVVRDAPDARLYFALGRNLGRLGDVAGAEQALRSALALEPRLVQGRYSLAKLLWGRAEYLWQKGKKEEARDLYRAAAEQAGEALAVKADHALAHMILGLCRERLGQEEKALASLRRAVECGSDEVETLLRLGEFLAGHKKEAEARPYLERAVRLAGPNDPRPRAALEKLKTPGK